MNTAVITITPEQNKVPATMDVQTNGVTNLDMIEALQTLSKHFAQAIIKEAQALGCDLGDDLEGYIQFLRKNKL